MLIDLSHPIAGGMTVFPGDPAVSIENAASIETDGFRVSSLHLGTHTGTHLDAPAHSIADGATLEAVALDDLVAPLVVLDATGRAARDRIGVDVLNAAPEIAPGDIVAVLARAAKLRTQHIATDLGLVVGRLNAASPVLRDLVALQLLNDSSKGGTAQTSWVPCCGFGVGTAAKCVASTCLS